MKMKKINYTGLVIIYSIVFALINLFVFLLFKPGNMESAKCKSTFWWSYGFLTVSFIAQVVVLFAVKLKNGLNALFLGIPLFVVSIMYFVAELFVSLIFMLLSAVGVETPYELVIIIQVILLAVFVVAAIISLMAQKAISAIDEKQTQNVRNIRNFVADVEIATEYVENEELKQLILNLAEDIRYSDPMSIDLVKGIEERLANTILDIKIAASNNEVEKVKVLVKTAQILVKERNIKIANNK